MPDLYTLAAARLRANQGLYLVAVLPDGTIRHDWNRYALSPDRNGFMDTEGRWHPREQCRIVNAATVRDNTLDVLEELADALNIGNLLRDRLEQDGLTGGRLDGKLAQFRACVHTAAVCMEEIRAELPEHYRRDQCPVQRDEVTP